jgi:hypothetical protein
MEDVVELLGWVAAVCAGGALSNYALKAVGRTYLKKVPAKYARQVELYRAFMRFMVRRHRVFGASAVFFLAVHAALVILGSALSVTGGAAALGFVSTASLGAHGFYVKKDLRAPWLRVHRAFAFLSLLTLITHLFYRGVLFL